MPSETLYDDGRIACDDEGLTIRWYYLWGSKRFPYGAIRSARSFTLGLLQGKWRLWGSGNLRTWFHLDLSRPRKERGIELDTGRWAHPCLTPDDVDAVVAILEERLSA